MDQQEKKQDTDFCTHEKKAYNRPELIILGKVSHLTAGGSSGASECEVLPDGSLECNGDPNSSKP